MVNLVNTLNSVLEEKKRVDERAKQVALQVLSEWVEEQLDLCTTDHGVVTRESAKKSEAMKAELQVSLSTALNMDYEALAHKATAILRSRSSEVGTISDLVRFDGYAMLYPRTIKLQYKH